MSPTTFITEACVEYTQESLTEQRFPEDFHYDDITIGQTLLNACRRRADQKVVCRDIQGVSFDWGCLYYNWGILSKNPGRATSPNGCKPLQADKWPILHVLEGWGETKIGGLPN